MSYKSTIREAADKTFEICMGFGGIVSGAMGIRGLYITFNSYAQLFKEGDFRNLGNSAGFLALGTLGIGACLWHRSKRTGFFGKDYLERDDKLDNLVQDYNQLVKRLEVVELELGEYKREDIDKEKEFEYAIGEN